MSECDPIVYEALKRLRGEGSWKELATKLGISAPYMSDILNGNRQPGESTLAKLGLKRSVVRIYQPEDTPETPHETE